MRGLIYTIILATILSIMIGCKARPNYVPVESLEKQTDVSKRDIKDSIRIIEVISTKDYVNVRDSIVYKYNENGEIVSKEVYKWKERYRENNYLLKQLQSKYDSLLQVKQSEIVKEVPYPVIETKEVNKLTFFQKLQIYGFRLILIGLLIRYRKNIYTIFKKLFF